MADFDPVRAAREELAGRVEIAKLVRQRTREAEDRHTQAEAEVVQLRKLAAFADSLVEVQRAEVQRLVDRMGGEQR